MTHYPMADDAENALVDALAKLQAEIPTIEKGETAKVPTKAGGSYTYTYANLATVTAAILPRLGRLGLAFIARPTIVGAEYVLDCTLRHREGGRIESVYPLPDPRRASPQELGSAITYGRRYVLCSLTGVAPGGDDDDAAEAGQKRPDAAIRTQRARPLDRPRLANGTTTSSDPFPDAPYGAGESPEQGELHQPGSGEIPDVTGTAEAAPTRRPRSAAQLANDKVRSATPPELRGDDRQLDRRALYALVGGWGAQAVTLTPEAVSEYGKFARLVARGQATLVSSAEGEAPPWRRLVDVEGVSLAYVESDMARDNPSSSPEADEADRHPDNDATPGAVSG